MNAYLTTAMHRFLSAIRDSEDEYAIQEGREVWVDYERFSIGTVNKCLKYCLIKEEDSDERMFIWILNEDGRGVLEDDNYVPHICRPRG